MIQRIACLIFLLSITSPLMAQDAVKASARVQAATIYRQGGADIMMQVTATVKQGSSRISLPALLPDRIDRDTILTRPVSDGLDILATNITPIKSLSPPSAAVLAAQKTLKELKTKMSRAQNDYEAAAIQLKFLKNANPDTKSGLTERLGLLDDRLAPLMSAKLEASLKLDALKTSLKEAKENLEKLLEKETNRLSLSLDIFADHAGPVEILLTYTSNEASWQPALEAYLKTENKRLEFRLKALIKQNTGVDWQGIPVKLQVKRNTSFSYPPYLNSVFVGLSASPPRDMYTDDTEVEEIVVTSGREDRRRPSKPKPRFAQGEAIYEERPDKPRFEADGQSQSYALSSVTLVSGKDQQTVALASHDQPVDIKIVALPEKSSKSILMVDLTYTDAVRLAAIKTDRFVDGVPLGPVSWPKIEPGDRVELPFDYVAGITVSDNPKTLSEETTGIFRSKKNQTIRRSYRVENQTQQVATVEIRGVVPRSVADRLDILWLETSTPVDLEGINDKPGLVGWVRTLQPGQKVEIDFGYRLTYPEDLFLVVRD